MIKFNSKDYKPVVTNKTGIKKIKGKTMDDVTELIKKVLDSAQARITDVGHFSVRIEQKNTNPVKYLSSYGVLIKPEAADDKSARIIRFFAKNESRSLEHESKNIVSGNRAEILEYLKSEGFKKDLQDYIDMTSDKFYLNNNR